MRHITIAALLLSAFGLSSQALAERTIEANVHRDRLAGMWTGQLLGNYAGRQVEGLNNVTYEGTHKYDSPIPITSYTPQWDVLTQGQYYPKPPSSPLPGYVPSPAGSSTVWNGDDDTSLEFLYLHTLSQNAAPGPAERTDLWQNHLNLNGLYIANRQAWYQINQHGTTALQSGQVNWNLHAGWAIDSQITTESLGALTPGMRQRAVDLAGDFGGITNEGYPVHAAQFYAAMYAQAPFSADVQDLVDKGLEALPEGSWTRQIVAEARALYQQDLSDGQADDWLAGRNAILAFAGQRGRAGSWVESSSNTGLTSLALLYGQGSFMKTVELGVRGGKDSDCNPATAGGLIGMMKGQDSILAELAAAGYSPDLPAIYDDSTTVALDQDQWTMTNVLDLMQAATEKQIVAGGGSIVQGPTGTFYSLPDGNTGLDALSPGSVLPPSGPAGLVGKILQQGGSVEVVVTRNGLVMPDGPTYDRRDQQRLIDGMSDLRYSGVLAFDTYDGSDSPRTDAYELHFDQEVIFQALKFFEGDVRYNGINSDPNDSQPHGGYFTQLGVEVLQDGQWVQVDSLQMDQELNPLEFFQTIELSFEAIEGSAIRLVGQAGGLRPYTSATEIEVYGVVPEPSALLLLVSASIGLLPRRAKR
jgi:hypothetical protein